MLPIHEFYHDSEKKYTLKHGKFFEIFNVAAKPMVMENLERSWKKSWKVKEFQELKRVQTLMGDGKFCLSNILARKMRILIMCFCKTRIDLFGLYVMFSHLIEVFIEVFIKKSVMTYVWLYNQ